MYFLSSHGQISFEIDGVRNEVKSKAFENVQSANHFLESIMYEPVLYDARPFTGACTIINMDLKINLRYIIYICISYTV